MRRQPGGIAVAGRLFPARFSRFDDGYRVALAEKLDGADGADNAGPYDDHVAGHAATPSAGTKSLA